MNAAAKFPLDLTELTIFRVVQARLGTAAQAVHFFWLLWRELAQLVGQGEPTGRMRAIHMEVFIGLLVDLKFFPDREAAMAFLADPLLEHGLLQRDGSDYVCLRFIALNADMALRGKREKVGGYLKAYDARQAKAFNEEMQLALRTPARIWVDEHEEPLPMEIQDRIRRLVISCDNALKRERPPIGWTESLIQQALPIIGRYTDEQIGFVCRKVAACRDHPRLAGLTTERLLPNFTTIIADLGE